MGVARLCMVRHGETAWNAARRIQGQLDLPLSDAEVEAGGSWKVLGWAECGHLQ
jgi:bisphosphoglycerate-dependent phosphoglycerate mutase